MTITSDDCQLREALGNLLKASDELASAIELSSESFDTGLLDEIAPSKRELILAANAARKILNAGTSTRPDITKKAIAANIEAMRKMLMDTVLRTSEAFEAIQAGEQNQASAPCWTSTGIWKTRSLSTARPLPSTGPGGHHEKNPRPHSARDPAT